MDNQRPDDRAHATEPLDREVCRQARLARDPRFDGEFFLAVRTTGIYCRPICPARAPAEKNVSYYRSSAQAAQAGFRPCLRCRPESAPGSPAWLGSSTTVHRALRLIQEGAFNPGSVAVLAARLGVGERYLRKLFQRELGTSPQAVALNQRLLFARKLLAETDLPITEIAFAAGFGSIRRFNSAIKTQFRQSPGDLRGRHKSGTAGDGISLQLQYRPPYDWQGVMNFFNRHAIPGVESTEQGCYRRNLLLAGQPAHLQVRSIPGRAALQLSLRASDHGLLMPLVANVRRMFDLDANPAVIAQQLQRHAPLAPLLAAFPGIRAPGHWSLYEASIRTIVGQQVSTVAARSICGRLAAAACADPAHPVFPAASALAELDDSHFPMPGRRRDTLRSICQQFGGREDKLDLAALGACRGVGPWTTAMVSMRGAGDPDVFPDKDLGLEKAWQTVAHRSGELREHSPGWRPWRSYAANLLWRSLSP